MTSETSQVRFRNSDGLLLTPHYHLVPKGFEDNLRFRNAVLRDAGHDPDMRLDLRRMCADDVLFYVNAFVWTYNPRLPSPIVPFITYPYQDEAIMTLLKATGMVPGHTPQDVFVEKSRDMGGSWMSILVHEYLWHWRDMLSFLWVSRKEDLVDKTDDPKSLMWKLDFLLKWLPPFLRPNYQRSRLHAKNLDSGSTIDGESTTGDVARGDRRTSILLDEFASVEEGEKVLAATADATDCRMFNSTPKGTGTAFYTVKMTEIESVTMHWKRHPNKGAGLYTSEDGRLKVLDPVYAFPTDYKFILDGKIRSPWYDSECRRRASKLEIAQELDIDYHASGSQFYDAGVLKEAEAELIRPPLFVGEIQYTADAEPTGLVEKEGGRLRVWGLLNSLTSKPAQDRRYVMGSDVSAGSDASPSCASIGDVQTGEKVVEFATINMPPYRFAELCVALARWYRTPVAPCFMVWEMNGPGGPFGKRVLELGYTDVYYRRSSSGRPASSPGWHANAETRRELHESHRRALAAKTFINRSRLANDEAAEYIYTMTGSVEHARSRSTSDPTGARANHGDRCKADALCWLGFEGSAPEESPEPETPEHCFAARQEAARKARRANREDVW